jgi:hypothetical protein
LIAAAATVTGATIPIASKWFESSGALLRVTTKRQRSIAGKWNGTGRDVYAEKGAPLINMDVRFDIHLRFKKVTAEGEIQVRDPSLPPIKLIMEGGFCNPDLIQFTYRSADPKRIQSGVILLKLSEDADVITGHYAGFSPTRGCLLMGELRVSRVRNT